MDIPYLKNYCIIGLSDDEDEIDAIKEDLTVISETTINFVSGSYLLIATFSSAFTVSEIHELLEITERSYIIFEMTPGYFSVNFKNKEYQDALFGSVINTHKNSFIKLEEMIEKLRDEIIPIIENVKTEDSYIKKTYEERLKEALKNENYEEAAKLRDKIKKNKK